MVALEGEPPGLADGVEHRRRRRERPGEPAVLEAGDLVGGPAPRVEQLRQRPAVAALERPARGVQLGAAVGQRCHAGGRVGRAAAGQRAPDRSGTIAVQQRVEPDRGRIGRARRLRDDAGGAGGVQVPGARAGRDRPARRAPARPGPAGRRRRRRRTARDGAGAARTGARPARPGDRDGRRPASSGPVASTITRPWSSAAATPTTSPAGSTTPAAPAIAASAGAPRRRAVRARGRGPRRRAAAHGRRRRASPARSSRRRSGHRSGARRGRAAADARAAHPVRPGNGSRTAMRGLWTIAGPAWSSSCAAGAFEHRPNRRRRSAGPQPPSG